MAWRVKGLISASGFGKKKKKELWNCDEKSISNSRYKSLLFKSSTYFFILNVKHRNKVQCHKYAPHYNTVFNTTQPCQLSLLPNCLFCNIYL